jgi:polyisoprenoid-binding protein YceI
MKISFAKGTACALLGLLPALPSAFAQSPTTPALGSVKAGDYKVEGNHTQVVFSVLHFGFTDFSGLFAGASGTLKLDPAQLATSKLEVTIPMQSAITTVSKLNDELKGEKWFDVAKFPSATFSSTKVSSTSKGELLISGNLTLHGVTKPVLLHARLVGAGVNPLDKAYTIGFEATGTVKRSEFGVSTYVPAVSDDVRLTIAGAFELEK